MNRGISFIGPNEWGHIVRDVFDGIDVEPFQWRIRESQIIKHGDYIDQVRHFCGDKRFSDDWYSGKDFKAQFSAPPEHYVSFFDCLAFKTRESFSQIKTYADFVDSSCEIILLIADGRYIEVYMKNKKILGQVMKNAIEKCYGDVEYITDKNDDRTEMRVW